MESMKSDKQVFTEIFMVRLKKPAPIQDVVALDKSLKFLSRGFYINVYRTKDNREFGSMETVVEEFKICDRRNAYKDRKLIISYIINWTSKYWSTPIEADEIEKMK